MSVVNVRRVERATSYPRSNRKKGPKRRFREEDPRSPIITTHRDFYNLEKSLSHGSMPRILCHRVYFYDDKIELAR